MNPWAQISEGACIGPGLGDGVMPGELTLQPVHALHDAGLLGAEARGGHGWTREACARLTAQVLRLACEEASLWPELPGVGPLWVSVRLQTATCLSTLARQVGSALTASHLPGAALELGLCARSAYVAGPDELLALSSLRDIGVGLTLDLLPDMAWQLGDRGRAGLFRLPLTQLRLPPCMADEVAGDATARGRVREVVRAARVQGACVAATGVRSCAQRDILAELGCDAAQGPLFGLPMHPARFQAALSSDALA